MPGRKGPRLPRRFNDTFGLSFTLSSYMERVLGSKGIQDLIGQEIYWERDSREWVLTFNRDFFFPHALEFRSFALLTPLRVERQKGAG